MTPDTIQFIQIFLAVIAGNVIGYVFGYMHGKGRGLIDKHERLK